MCLLPFSVDHGDVFRWFVFTVSHILFLSLFVMYFVSLLFILSFFQSVVILGPCICLIDKYSISYYLTFCVVG